MQNFAQEKNIACTEKERRGRASRQTTTLTGHLAQLGAHATLGRRLLTCFSRRALLSWSAAVREGVRLLSRSFRARAEKKVNVVRYCYEQLFNGGSANRTACTCLARPLISTIPKAWKQPEYAKSEGCSIDVRVLTCAALGSGGLRRAFSFANCRFANTLIAAHNEF